MQKPKPKKTTKHQNPTLPNQNNKDVSSSSSWHWLTQKGLILTFLCISLFGFLIRVCVSLHPYSGAGTPPKYGDFEAQRHWMEITTNLPAKEWYFNTSSNDLSYWGLDYPPLTAYQSYLHGLVLRMFNPDSVALFTSRGYETYLGKLLMRWTVMSSDALVFFPAIYWFLCVYHGSRRRSQCEVAWHIAMLVVNPCLILIDHGHFQYNCISLGFTVGAVAAILSQRDLLASVLFCLALNHKQMSAYYAPAFFSYLLGKCLRRRYPFFEVLKLGLVVIGTFCAVWWPYLHSSDAFLQVLSRLAPFDRGLYEDYVANFWCATSILIKWKRLFTTPSLKLFTLVATVVAFSPSMFQQILDPSSKGFLYGMLNSSFAFYLFSFQVHEKSILLPLLPASLLALDEPFLYKWLTHFGLLSMFPLLLRDRLVLPYVVLYALYFLLYDAPGEKLNSEAGETSATYRILMKALVFCSFILHIIYLAIHPPDRYPFLFEALIMILCFSQFALLAVYTNKKQWTLLKNHNLSDRGKKFV